MSNQSQQKTQATKDRRILLQQYEEKINQQIKIANQKHPECIPIRFIKHPQAPDNVKQTSIPFILFQREAKIQQAMLSLIRQIGQKDIYFFCPYLDQNKLKYSILKKGPTIQEVYKKFGRAGYLTLTYSDANLGMQGMLTLQKWMIRLLVTIVLLWILIYGYAYIQNYFRSGNNHKINNKPKTFLPDNNTLQF